MGKYDNAWEEFEGFCKYLINKNRFILNKEWNLFVNRILSSAHKRARTFPPKHEFWRARVGGGPKFTKAKIMSQAIPLPNKEVVAPPVEKCTEGRANSRGIRYLYLADNWRTAMAEVRPHKSAFVTIGKFSLNKQIKVIDVFSKRFSLTDYYLKKSNGKSLITDQDEEKLLWWSIDLAFSIPLNPTDTHKDYVPTQFLAELFKNNGYDGILYGSSQFNRRYNIVLFNPKKATIQSKIISNIGSIQYKTSDEINRQKFRRILKRK